MGSLVEAIEIGDKEYFPVLRNLWDFFAAKGNKVIFVSVGVSDSPLVELHFSEALGCKLHIFDENNERLEKWKEVKEVLKTRKTTETTSVFTKQAIKKWVLPQNILPSNESFSFGTTKPIVSALSISLQEERIDILKVAADTKTIASTLYPILHYGYRPSILMIQWETTPDSTVETTILAGHIQNIGYGLVSKFKNNYLYLFTDKNLYEMCSWESLDHPNPLVAKIVESISMKNQEKE